MSTPDQPRTVDKSAWVKGPWTDEPDYVRFDHLGLPCILARSEGSGHWCGYVGVPPGHPWHGKDDSNTPDEIRVHGGITYGNPCQFDVCHVPKPGEPDDVWWLGFDAAHAGDVSPGYLHRYRHREMACGGPHADVYRDQAYMTVQTKGLATQARRAQGWTLV